MTRTRFLAFMGGLASVAMLAVLVSAGRGDEKPKGADRTKTVVIEKPTAAIVAGSTATKDADANPKVKPGDVKWHASFADARKASEKSGKPVLLFQLMGKLDDQFC
jgi:hypothetical protein